MGLGCAALFAASMPEAKTFPPHMHACNKLPYLGMCHGSVNCSHATLILNSLVMCSESMQCSTRALVVHAHTHNAPPANDLVASPTVSNERGFGEQQTAKPADTCQRCLKAPRVAGRHGRSAPAGRTNMAAWCVSPLILAVLPLPALDAGVGVRGGAGDGLCPPRPCCGLRQLQVRGLRGGRGDESGSKRHQEKLDFRSLVRKLGAQEGIDVSGDKDKGKGGFDGSASAAASAAEASASAADDSENAKLAATAREGSATDTDMEIRSSNDSVANKLHEDQLENAGTKNTFGK